MANLVDVADSDFGIRGKRMVKPSEKPQEKLTIAKPTANTVDDVDGSAAVVLFLDKMSTDPWNPADKTVEHDDVGLKRNFWPISRSFTSK